MRTGEKAKQQGLIKISLNSDTTLFASIGQVSRGWVGSTHLVEVPLGGSRSQGCGGHNGRRGRGRGRGKVAGGGGQVGRGGGR